MMHMSYKNLPRKKVGCKKNVHGWNSLINAKHKRRVQILRIHVYLLGGCGPKVASENGGFKSILR